MDAKKIKLLAIFCLICLFFVGGCQQNQNMAANENSKPASPAEKLQTIADVATISGFGNLQIQGYGLVTGLAGTGSTKCPSQIRVLLTNFIKTRLPANSKVNIDQLIDSKDTAVVSILGLLPAGAVKNEKFDIVVSTLSSTQATSLEGGRLLEAELRQIGKMGQTRPYASVEGSIFMDSDADKMVGYVLNGGKVLENQPIVLSMKKPDYVLTSKVRDRINGYFGEKSAIAINESNIYVTIPEAYKSRKQKFFDLLGNMYIDISSAAAVMTIDELTEKLKANPNDLRIQVQLEVMGPIVGKKLVNLLESDNPDLVFSVATILLQTDNYQGYQALADFAFQGSTAKRLEAMNTIAWHARRKDASGVLNRLLGDDDFEIKLSAYNHLKRFKDISISTKIVETSSGDFELDRIVKGSDKIVWAAKSGQPRIVLFGSPIYCEDNIFIQNTDGSIMASSQQGDDFVTIVIKDPRTDTVESIKCSRELGIVISRLCQITRQKEVDGNQLIQRGLGVNYSQMIDFVALMCKSNAVEAEFIAGPEPEIKNAITAVEQ